MGCISSRMRNRAKTEMMTLALSLLTRLPVQGSKCQLHARNQTTSRERNPVLEEGGVLSSVFIRQVHAFDIKIHSRRPLNEPIGQTQVHQKIAAGL